jgi:hypothetical protein
VDAEQRISTKVSVLPKGKLVWVLRQSRKLGKSEKLLPKFEGPFPVVEQISPQVVKVLRGNRVVKYHRSALKIWVPPFDIMDEGQPEAVMQDEWLRVETIPEKSRQAEISNILPVSSDRVQGQDNIEGNVEGSSENGTPTSGRNLGASPDTVCRTPVHVDASDDEQMSAPCTPLILRTSARSTKGVPPLRLGINTLKYVIPFFQNDTGRWNKVRECSRVKNSDLTTLP